MRAMISPPYATKTRIVSHLAAVSKAIIGVVRELRKPLPGRIENIYIARRAQVIRILHAQDDADLLIVLRAGKIGGRIHANEVTGMLVNKPIPLREPLLRDFVGLRGIERNRRMENIDPGSAKLRKFRCAKRRGLGLPLAPAEPSRVSAG